MDTFSIFIFWNLQYLILLMTFFLKSVPFHFRSSISPTSLGIIVNKLHQLFSIRPYLLFCFLWFSSWPHSSLTLHFFPWGISPIIWVLDLVPGSSPYTIKQLWHYLLEVSVRCHWWRAQPPIPTSNISCKCTSSLLLLTNQLQIGSSNNPFCFIAVFKIFLISIQWIF